MLYIQNKSEKIVYLGTVMLLPDERVENEISPEQQKENPLGASRYSDVLAIKRFIQLGILELVDVVTVPKKTEDLNAIRTIYEEEETEETPESSKKSENVSEEKSDSKEEKPAAKTGRKSNKKAN